MIQRYEAGRSNTPPVELCAFYDESQNLSLGTTATLYEEHISSRRARLPLSRLKNIVRPFGINPHSVVPNPTMRKMRQCIEDYSDVRPTANNKRMSDEYFLSATLHVHPYSFRKWQESGNVPAVVLDILNNTAPVEQLFEEEVPDGEVAQED